MNPEMNGQQPTPEQQLMRMQGELNDAHLVIGQQQVALLRMQSALQQQQESMLAMQARLLEFESKTMEEVPG